MAADACGPAMDSKVVRADAPVAGVGSPEPTEPLEPEPLRRPRRAGRGIEEVERDVLEMCRLTYEEGAALSEQMAVRVASVACLVSSDSAVCPPDLPGRLPIAKIAGCWENFDGAPGAPGASGDESESCKGNNPKVLADCVGYEVRTGSGSSGAGGLTESGKKIATLADCHAVLKKSEEVMGVLCDIARCLGDTAGKQLMPLPPSKEDDLPDEIFPPGVVPPGVVPPRR